jgi:hypothetical protein
MIQHHRKLGREDLHDRLLPELMGRVFHVTTRAAFAKIIQTGAIEPNHDGSLGYNYEQDANSYFRRRGCVSVVDLRAVAAEDLELGLSRYYFLNLSFVSNRPTFLIISPSCHQRLISWYGWKSERAHSETVVPYIEAGFPGSIATRLAEEALLVDVDGPSDHTEEVIRVLTSARRSPGR